MPFYFQGVQDTSALTSGIRFMPLVIPQITAIIVSGAVVSKFGFYVSHASPPSWPHLTLAYEGRLHGRWISIYSCGIWTHYTDGTGHPIGPAFIISGHSWSRVGALHATTIYCCDFGSKVSHVVLLPVESH